MNFKPPKIYAITDTAISGLSHVEQVERLIKGGIKLIQIREKQASPHDLFEAVRAAVTVARTRAVQIIINDRIDIAIAVRADGVHLGQDDVPPERARAIMGPEAIIGFSTHSVEQARAAAKLPVDYLAIGPVFATTTKDNAEPVVGLEGLMAVKGEIGCLPLVAIGGVNSENIAEVLRSGADSAALIGALLSETEEIEENARNLISLVNS
ncbi:MAG: thiamine phosphate synthase [Acidobacteriota bacterium]